MNQRIQSSPSDDVPPRFDARHMTEVANLDPAERLLHDIFCACTDEPEETEPQSDDSTNQNAPA